MDDGRLGLKHESGGSVLSCVGGIQEQLIGFDEGEGRVLGGSRSSGGSSPESGHFTGSNASGDEHSASPEMSPGTNCEFVFSIISIFSSKKFQKSNYLVKDESLENKLGKNNRIYANFSRCLCHFLGLNFTTSTHMRLLAFFENFWRCLNLNAASILL